MRAVLYLLAFLSAAAAQTQPPPLNRSDISIVQASYSGNGCPQGTVSTSFSADRETITFSFYAVQLFAGPGVTSADQTKNCQLRVQLRYPPGWAFSIASTHWHGYFTLPDGVRAQFYTTFELVSRDTEVINVPRAILNGSSAVSEQRFDAELPVAEGNRLKSMCSSESSSNDIVIALDRWALTRLKSDVYMNGGWMVEDIPLVQLIQLQWQGCR